MTSIDLEFLGAGFSTFLLFFFVSEAVFSFVTFFRV